MQTVSIGGRSLLGQVQENIEATEVGSSTWRLPDNNRSTVEGSTRVLAPPRQ